MLNVLIHSMKFLSIGQKTVSIVGQNVKKNFLINTFGLNSENFCLFSSFSSSLNISGVGALFHHSTSLSSSSSSLLPKGNFKI